MQKKYVSRSNRYLRVILLGLISCLLLACGGGSGGGSDGLTQPPAVPPVEQPPVEEPPVEEPPVEEPPVEEPPVEEPPVEEPPVEEPPVEEPPVEEPPVEEPPVEEPPVEEPPVAEAGSDQSAVVGAAVSLDGGDSVDSNGGVLTYAWSFVSVPASSSAALVNPAQSNAYFIPDVVGVYNVRLIVNNGTLASLADTVKITVGAVTTFSDDFSGTGDLVGYVTNNAASLPDVGRVAGRYRANLVNNAGEITLHFNNYQGRLDAKAVSFPFEAIARNIGIGTQANSQQAPSSTGTPYNPFLFAGVQVHVMDLDSRNSSHVVVGHRGNTPFTVEGKNTLNGSSSVNDDGANIVPSGRADIRIVGNSDRTLTVYWQTPNTSPGVNPDNWNLYLGDGKLPGPAPSYGSQVYVGLITYASDTIGVPFVGTADSFTITWE